jgi:IS5 family transposase
LSRQGYLARGGQIVDASLIPVPIQRNRQAAQALVKNNAMPADWQPAQRRQKDVDASWTQKHGMSHFGYKLSANTSRDLYGDKGYVDGDREFRLKQTGWRVHLQRKAAKGKPLSDGQKGHNTRIANASAGRTRLRQH